MNKLIAKPSDDPTKLPRVRLRAVQCSAHMPAISHSNSRSFVLHQAQQEHDDAKEIFDMLNDSLIAELPELLQLRVPYFDPSFEAMIRMQCKFAEAGYEKLSGVQRCVRASSRLQIHLTSEV